MEEVKIKLDPMAVIFLCGWVSFPIIDELFKHMGAAIAGRDLVEGVEALAFVAIYHCVWKLAEGAWRGGVATMSATVESKREE